jgi:hypothetical protein
VTATTAEHREGLRAALAALVGCDIPERAPSSWIAAQFGLRPTTVVHAIRAGKLPAESVESTNGSVLTFMVRPEDALVIWGHRLTNRS